MSITFRCQECGKPYAVDEKLAGRKAKCKACGAVMAIPASPAEPATAPTRTAARHTAPPPAERRAATAPVPPKPPPPPSSENPFDDFDGFMALESNGSASAPPPPAPPRQGYAPAPPPPAPIGVNYASLEYWRRKPVLFAAAALLALSLVSGLAVLVVHALSPRPALGPPPGMPPWLAQKAFQAAPPRQAIDFRAQGEMRLRQFAEALKQYLATHDGRYPARMADVFTEPVRQEIEDEQRRYQTSIRYWGNGAWTAPLPPEIDVADWLMPPQETILFADGHIETVDINEFNDSGRRQAAERAMDGLARRPAPIQQIPGTGGGVLAFPSFGVTCSLPAGWSRVSEGGDVQVFQVVKIEGGKSSPEGILRLEIGPRQAPDLKSFAESVAGTQKMAISDTPAALGGLSALELTATDPPAGQPAVVRGVVAEYAGYYAGLYQIAGADAPREGFDAVASRLTWSDPKPSADALTRGGNGVRGPLWLQGAGLVCDLPDPFRVSQMSPQRVRCITYDLTAQALDAALTVTYLPSAGADMGRYKDRAVQTAGGKAAFASEPVWTDLSGPVTLSYTGVIPLLPGSDGKPQRPRQLVLAMLPNHRPAVLLFDYQEQTAERYAAAVKDWIVPSFRSSRSYEEGRAAVPQPVAPN